MTLPPPDYDVYWKDYQIDTPTFDLTPVEKPDMSPFLVHMTGKREIESILRGEGAPTQLPPNHGYLRSSVPEYDQGVYNAPVVCFTESPTFALDFFRYRSFRRWQNDQRFGIGFRKSLLVRQGVRPAVYMDDVARRHFIYLYKRGVEDGEQLSNDAQTNSAILEMLNTLYPFIFPLLENRPEQGFMWEREWRHPDANGFVFPYDAISVICCPDNEEEQIKGILGDYSARIQFVNTWREYDEVTNFLRKQSLKWQDPVERLALAKGTEEKLSWLSELSQQYAIAINSLAAYGTFIEGLSAQKRHLEQERLTLESALNELNAQIEELQTEIRTREQEDGG